MNYPWASNFQCIPIFSSMSSLQREEEQYGNHHPEPRDYLKTVKVDRMTRESSVRRTANGRCRAGDQRRIWEERILHSEILFQLPIKEMFEEDLEINILIVGPLRTGHELKNTPYCFWNAKLWKPLEQIIPPLPQRGQCWSPKLSRLAGAVPRPRERASHRVEKAVERAGSPVLRDSCWPRLKCKNPVILSGVENIYRHCICPGSCETVSNQPWKRTDFPSFGESPRDQEPHAYCIRVNATDSTTPWMEGILEGPV